MPVDHHLLEKYWAGQCTPDEQQAVEQWLADGIPQESYELRSPDTESAIKDQLWQQIAQANSSETKKHEPAKIAPMLTWSGTLKIAAILFLLIGTGLYLSHHIIIPDQVHAEALTEYQEFVVPNGKRANITLSDGSKVYLNSGSRLRYPSKFSGTERRVILEGEGFFKVAKNPEKPFYVQARQTTTRVLGTHFNLQSRPGQPDRLNVEEGKVRFTAAGCKDTLLVLADMQAVFDGHSLVSTMISSKNTVAWTKGKMIFDGVKLVDVIAELERWYDVKITMSNPELGNHSVKAQFDNPSLTNVLADISFALNIKYKIKDKEVMLSK